MQLVSGNGFWFLLKASGQATLLIVVVWTLHWLLGARLTPRWRFRLWLLVALRLALPWTVPSAASPFNLFRSSAVAAAADSLQAGPVLPDSPARPLARSAPSQPPSPVTLISPEATSSTIGLARAWLPLAWAVGASAVLLGLVANHLRFHRKVAGHRPLVEEKALNLLEDCKQRMGIRAPVSLVETAAVSGPALFGCLRPRVLLPPGFTRSFSQEELRFVFLHELGHLKRHDILFGWLMALVQVLHWFNPLVWLAFARMRLERELACDALALSYTADHEHKPYGLTIIKLLEDFGDSLHAPTLAGIVEDSQQIKERITMIAHFHRTDRGLALGACLFAALALVTLTDAQNVGKEAAQTQTPAAENQWNLEQKVQMATAGNQWAVYDLWDAYARGRHGLQPDPAQAEKWLGELVKEVWVVRFEPMDDFTPTTPEEFLERIDQYSSSHSGRTNIGAASFFRTTRQGDKLVGSFLSNYPEQLKTSLAKVPGLKVTSVERLTPQAFIKYEQSPQESLWSLPLKIKLAQAGNDWATYDLWDAYARGHHGVQPDPAQAEKWLGQLVKDVWVVRFEPVADFAPKGPAEFLERIDQYSSCRSGRTNIGAASFFRTTKQGDKLAGSFLSNYPEQLKASLAKVPGLKVTSVERITPEKFISYEASPQESLSQAQPSGDSPAAAAAELAPPRLIATSPRLGATDVDQWLTELTVTFDQDMGGGMSWTGGGPEFPPAREGQKAQWRNKRTCVLPVKLEAAHHYRMGINSTSYRNFAS